MAQAFTPGLHAGLTRVKRRRELPLAGETLVAVGDAVASTTIVATASLEGELRLVRVAEQLGIEAREVQAFLRCAVGDQLEEGQLIAEMHGFFGLFKSRVYSPIAGTFELLSESTGHVGIRAASRVIGLPAYTAGTVVEVEAGRAVVIETPAAFVQGIFGVGGEKAGTLEVLPIDPSARLEESAIPEICDGKVLVGGQRPTIEALRLASERGAVGIVTGSIDDTVLKEYVGYDIGVAITGDEPVDTTLIVTEGFGSIPMSERVLSLLRSNSGRECSINGATQVRAGALRPEIIVPRNDGSVGSKNPESLGLDVGARIRLIRVPYFGAMGTVTALPHEPEKIPSGAVTRVLRATLDDGREVSVPRANVELVSGSVGKDSRS